MPQVSYPVGLIDIKVRQLLPVDDPHRYRPKMACDKAGEQASQYEHRPKQYPAMEASALQDVIQQLECSIPGNGSKPDP